MFPGGGMKGLMKQAQEMQKKMKKMEDELKELRIKGSASGKLVEVEANGKKEIISIKIDPSILEEDIEMVEDLILASIKQTYNNVDNEVGEKMRSVTGGMNIPGIL
jgi:DNA-binding YbaB/EbfC family protein